MKSLGTWLAGILSTIIGGVIVYYLTQGTGTFPENSNGTQPSPEIPKSPNTQQYGNLCRTAFGTVCTLKQNKPIGSTCQCWDNDLGMAETGEVI